MRSYRNLYTAGLDSCTVFERPFEKAALGMWQQKYSPVCAKCEGIFGSIYLFRNTASLLVHYFGTRIILKVDQYGLQYNSTFTLYCIVFWVAGVLTVNKMEWL